MMYFGVVFFMFLVQQIPWASWIYGFIVFIKFGIFLFIIFSNTFPIPPLLFNGNSNYRYFRLYEVGLQFTDILFIFGFSLFSLCVSFGIASIAMSSSSLVFSSAMSNWLQWTKCLCPFQNSYVEILTPNMIVLEVEPSQVGLVPL